MQQGAGTSKEKSIKSQHQVVRNSTGTRLKSVENSVRSGVASRNLPIEPEDHAEL